MAEPIPQVLIPVDVYNRLKKAEDLNCEIMQGEREAGLAVACLQRLIVGVCAAARAGSGVASSHILDKLGEIASNRDVLTAILRDTAKNP